MEELKCAFKGFPITREEAMGMFMKTSLYDPQKEYVVQCVSNDFRCYTVVPRTIEPFFVIKEQQQPQQVQYMRDNGAATPISANNIDIIQIGEDGIMEKGYDGVGIEGDDDDGSVFYYGVSGFVVRSTNLYDLSVMRLTECVSFLNTLIGSKSLESMGKYTISDDIDEIFDDDENDNDN